MAFVKWWGGHELSDPLHSDSVQVDSSNMIALVMLGGVRGVS